MPDTQRFRPGTTVRVARLDPNRAKLAVCGYSLHEHYGRTGVVTDTVTRGGTLHYVVRFDKLGSERETFSADELEPATTTEAR